MATEDSGVRLPLRKASVEHRARVTRHAPLRSPLRTGFGKAVGKYPLRRIDDSDGADRMTAMVENRRRGARLAQHGFIAFGRDSAIADDIELVAKAGFVQGGLGQAGQRLIQEVFDDLRREKARTALPSELACGGSWRPTSRTPNAP